jgi:hypothetical protein
VRHQRILMFTLAVAVTVALGSWVRRAALDAGLWADDYAQVAMIEGTYPSPRPAWDLFHFLDGERDDHQRLVDYGAYPWWTHPHFRLSMLRPLPSLSCALDHALFRSAGTPQHLHSLLWWALLVAAVGALLFGLLPPLTAALALILFSVDESHTVPVLWLANRSALMATALTVASLVMHLRWRADPQRSSRRIASLVLCALGFACGEYAFASLAYVVSLELLQPTPGVTRARTLGPFVAIAVVFLVVSTVMGYGSAHSALYTSPFSAPVDYVSKVLVGFPVIMAELVLGVPADWWSFGSPWPLQLQAALSVSPSTWEQLPSWKTCQLALGGLSVLITLLVLRWLKRRLRPEHQHALVWLICGACLGVLPSMGSFITTRLAMPASFAFAALFASVLSVTFSAVSQAAARSHVARVAGAIFAALILYIHGYRSIAQSEAATGFYSLVARSRTHWALTAALDERKPAPWLVMIASADANDAAYTPFVRSAHGRAQLRGLRILSGAPGAHALTRIDDRTIEVKVLDDLGLSTSVAGSFTRAESDVLSTGDHARVVGMDVTVLQTHQGQPTHMRVSFDVPLESDLLAFVHSTPRGLEPVALPAVGSTLQVPPPTMPNLAVLAGP